VLILIFINSKPIAGEYIGTGEDYQSIKVWACVERIHGSV
jgi:NADH-quinone oxidoreductase subunit J